MSEREDSELRELLREEAEEITERLDPLVGAGTEESTAEALRLAHTLKGLAAAAETLPLLDLARSLEQALTDYSGDDTQRRAEILSGIDATRGLLAGRAGAPAAARRASATLEQRPRGGAPRRVPLARRVALRRLLPRLAPFLGRITRQLVALDEQRDDYPGRAALARDLELWAAAVGVLGQATLASLGLEVAAFFAQRSPPGEALSSLHRAVELLGVHAEDDGVDAPLARGVLATVEALRTLGPRHRDEERVAVAVELPWPDADMPGELLSALALLSEDRAVLDARPAGSDCRFLRGTLGLAPSRRGRREEEGAVRVSRRRLDRLLRRAEELVGAKVRARDLARLARRLADAAPPGQRLGLHRLMRLADEHERELDHLARSTQRAVLRARLVKVRRLLGLARMTAREYLARHPGKAVAVELEGGAIEVDKATLEALVEPVLHLVKNALEHGIETRAERAAAGKPELARLRIAVRGAASGVVLEIEDDGRGLDESLVAAQRDDLMVLRDESQEGLALAFAAGVTTARRVSDDAGRGVGLASVLERVRELRGRLELSSTPGEGSLARLVVPPAAAIARVLLVRAGSEHYALPLASVRGIEEAQLEGASRVPRVSLEELVGRAPTAAGSEDGAAARRRGRFAVRLAPLVSRAADDLGLAVVVDDVLRRDLVVVRPIGRRFAPPGVDGAALFGDGRLALVLDAWRLHLARRRAAMLQ